MVNIDDMTYSLLEVNISTIMDAMLHFMQPYTYLVLLGGILSVGAGLILHRDDKNRVDVMHRMLYIMLAFFLISFAVVMASDIQKILTVFDHNALIGATSPGAQLDSELAEMEGMKDVGLGELMLIGILELIAASFKQVKMWFISDMELKEILFGNVSKVFMNFNVKLEDGTTFDLYGFVLLLVGIVIFLMIVFRAYKIMREANVDDAEIELRDLFSDILEMIGKILMVPIIIYFLVCINTMIGNELNKIEVQSYSKISTLGALKYGMGISIAKIYITYMEMKLWLIILSRNFILNGLLIIGPLAVAVKAMSDEFTSLETWLTLAIKFAFIPTYYGLSFVLAVMFINYIPNKNPLTDVIVYSFIFRLVDVLIPIFALKMASRDGNKTPGMNIVAGLMAVRAVTNLLTSPLRTMKAAASGIEQVNRLGKIIK